MKITAPDIITNSILLEKYLTSDMRQYFYEKLRHEKEEYIQLKICELLKFLTLSHHTYGDIPFDEEIDEMWHLWILQTVQYQELMSQLPGNKFINHCSNDYPNKKTVTDASLEADLSYQISYLVSYVANFGEFTSAAARFWPMTKKLMQAMDFELHELNEYLKQQVLSVNDKS